MKSNAAASRHSAAWDKGLPSSLQSRRSAPSAQRRSCLAVRCGQLPSKAFEGFVARPPNSELHLGNAWSLAQACDLAYAKQDAVRATVGQWGLRGLRCFGFRTPDGDNDGPDTQCFVAAGEDYIVVSFRGSESVTDWVNDLEMWKAPGGPLGCEVHSGFLSGLQGEWRGRPVLDLVLEAVRELQARYGGDEPLAVYVTGHSLGAALATLTTAYMLEAPDLRDHVVGHYTFGSPRVGSSEFKKRFEEMIPKGRVMSHRFQNREDVVTKVPTRWRDFEHVGKWWYLSGDEQTLVNEPGWMTRMWDFLDVDWDMKPDFVYDHSITAPEGPGGYIQGLEKNILRSP